MTTRSSLATQTSGSSSGSLTSTLVTSLLEMDSGCQSLFTHIIVEWHSIASALRVYSGPFPVMRVLAPLLPVQNLSSSHFQSSGRSRLPIPHHVEIIWSILENLIPISKDLSIFLETEPKHFCATASDILFQAHLGEPLNLLKCRYRRYLSGWDGLSRTMSTLLRGVMGISSSISFSTRCYSASSASESSLERVSERHSVQMMSSFCWLWYEILLFFPRALQCSESDFNCHIDSNDNVLYHKYSSRRKVSVDSSCGKISAVCKS